MAGRAPSSRAAEWLAKPVASPYGKRCTICRDEELSRELLAIFEALAADPDLRSGRTLSSIHRDFVVETMGRATIRQGTVSRHRNVCLSHLGPW